MLGIGIAVGIGGVGIGVGVRIPGECSPGVVEAVVGYIERASK